MIHRTRKLILGADRMLIEPPLPKATFPLGRDAGALGDGFGYGVGEPGLDPAPTLGIPDLTLWLGPDRMEMVWQNNHGVAGHRKLLDCPGIGKTQGVDVICQSCGAALFQPDGEEIGRSGEQEAAILGHSVNIAQKG